MRLHAGTTPSNRAGSKSWSRGPAAAQRGFTLIELLLATALIALIMAMAYGGFRAGVRATHSGEVLIEESNRLRVVHEFLRTRISLAQPLIIEDVDGEPIRFEGERDRVRFVAPLPGYLSYGGPYVQEFRVERGREGMDLVFAFAMLNGYEPGDLDIDPPVTLLENVGDLRLEYLGFAENGENVSWDSAWQEPERMPLAVALGLDMERDNGLSFPPLNTPLKVDSASTAQPRLQGAENILNPASRRLQRDQRLQDNQ
jgi:general secretion pathway protein J